MKKSVAQQVSDAIMTDILCNTFRPGQILSERMLTETYGCSKTTMREVLATLCHSRVLRSIPRLGYEVIWVEAASAQEVMEIRYILETNILRRSARNATPESLARLRECNARCREVDLTQDVMTQWDCCAQFHMELIRLSGSDYAQWSLQFALDTLKRALVHVGEISYGTVFGEGFTQLHDQIVDALERGDAEAACAALKEDLWLYKGEQE